MVDFTVARSMTYADYLESEGSSEIKHEWFNGTVYAMSRGTPEHARLSSRIGRILGAGLPGDCEVYSSDLMLYVASANLSTYADASLVCGPLETISVKRNRKSLGEGVTNPTVIVEVLSESTERYDREEKFRYYQTLPSLQEYVLISQDDPAIEVFRRPSLRAAGQVATPVASHHGWAWELARAGGTVTIHGCAIEVDAVYGTRR